MGKLIERRIVGQPRPCSVAYLAENRMGLRILNRQDQTPVIDSSMGSVTGFTDDFIRFSGTEYSPCINDGLVFSICGNFSRMIALLNSSKITLVTLFAKRRIFIYQIWDLEHE